MNRIAILYLALLLLTGLTLKAESHISRQPLQLHLNRLVEAMKFTGSPMPLEVKKKLTAASQIKDDKKAVALIQRIMDSLCCFKVELNKNGSVTSKMLVPRIKVHEKGWRQYLIKVENKAHSTGYLSVESPQAVYRKNQSSGELKDRWLAMSFFNGRPLNRHLSGLAVEYRLIQFYSRDAGHLKAKLKFRLDTHKDGQTASVRQDQPLHVNFLCLKAHKVKLVIQDHDGKPAMARIIVRDQMNRIYPPQMRRKLPDFTFHPQIYRKDGESLLLPPGKYRVIYTRGPEYLTQTKNIEVKGQNLELKLHLKRWCDPAADGWWSGDHHIHASGCAHFDKPSQGVGPDVMIRHTMGEDLKVGSVLTWGPGFDHQKKFFTGKEHIVSRYPYLLRYDIEVSGFGSQESGHLCLLNLKDQLFTGKKSKDGWPKLCLATLKWAKKQGAVTGFAHSGWGIQVNSDKLPNYIIPPFSGIGANEYIVDVTHLVPDSSGKLVPAVDFISAGDTPPVSELNIWYHTLNCGFRTKISGESDFPCIYGARVGAARVYAKVEGKLTYSKWCRAIQQGKSYVSDGLSHLRNFQVNEKGGEDGEVKIQSPKTISFNVDVRARLPKTVGNVLFNPIYPQHPYDEDPIWYNRGNQEAFLNGRPQDMFGAQVAENARSDWKKGQPYWHLERARIGKSNEVLAELIVNGEVVDSKKVVADGKLNKLKFDYLVKKSSWAAVRIFPSSHTNPVFIEVGGKPIRASKKSAEWCRKCVDQCWSQKKGFFDQNEAPIAQKAYEHARKVYDRIIEESQ